jgi:hypothetical protein
MRAFLTALVVSRQRGWCIAVGLPDCAAAKYWDIDPACGN